MNKRIRTLIGILVAWMLSVVLVANASAQFTCPKMEPVFVTTTSTWLKNVSGAACGTLAAGKQRYFFLTPGQSNPQLAILLTAISLNKTVWIHAPTDQERGATVNVIAIAK